MGILLNEAIEQFKETMKKPGAYERMWLRVALGALEDIYNLETGPWEGIDQRRIAIGALTDIKESMKKSEALKEKDSE